MRDYTELLEKLLEQSPESEPLDFPQSHEPKQDSALPADDNGYTKNVLMEGIPGMSDIGAPTRENLNPTPLRNDTPLDIAKMMQPKDVAPPVPVAAGLPKAKKALASSPSTEASAALPSTPQASPIDELKAAQEQRNSELNNLAIFRGLMNVGQGLGYQKYDPTIGKDFEAIANNKVADVMQRKEAQAKDIDFKKAALQLKNTEAESDPNSEVSKALREAIKMRYQSIGHPINIGQNLSAAQLKTMYPSGDLADDFLKMDAMKVNRATVADTKKAEKQNQAMTQTVQLLEQMRGSPAVGQAEKDLYAVDKVNSMVNLYGDPNKLNPAQIQLLASEVAKIASGGVPTHAELKGLQPSTIPSSLATLAEKVKNKPQGAEAGEFAKRMQDYTISLAKDAKKTIEDRYGRIVTAKKGLLNQEQYDTLQQQYVNRFKGDNSIKTAPATSEMIKVISPDGKAGSIPKEKLEEALKRGFKQVQ